jgi:hypothetical protein
LVSASSQEDDSQVDRLDQLYARSLREIEAHAGEMADMETGRYFIEEAAHLLAALRLWAQSQYRSDQVVREVLEAADLDTLRDIADELRAAGGRDARTAGATIAGMVKLPVGQLMASTSFALRAL